jgi:excisionase family DNA binding protein
MTHRPTNAKPLVLLGEAASILGVSKDTVLRGAKNGSIPCIRFGPRGQRRFDPDVLRAIRQQEPVEAEVA